MVNGADHLIWAGKADQHQRGGGWGGPGGAGLAQLFSQGARGWEPDCGGFTERGRWEEEAADVGHLFWKFGSKEGRKEVAQAAESRERFFVLNLFIFKYWGQGGCIFFQNEGDLGVLEEVASEVKTLKIVRTPGNQTSKE